jgi:hypothetical protein
MLEEKGRKRREQKKKAQVRRTRALGMTASAAGLGVR